MELTALCHLPAVSGLPCRKTAQSMWSNAAPPQGQPRCSTTADADGGAASERHRIRARGLACLGRKGPKSVRRGRCNTKITVSAVPSFLQPRRQRSLCERLPQRRARTDVSC